MANSSTSSGQYAQTPALSTPARPLYLVAQTRPLTWIKRRARKISAFYGVNRREAVRSARIDWVLFQPQFVQ